MRTRKKSGMLVSVGLMALVAFTSGCAGVFSAGRKDFASHALDGSAPILKEYRGYVGTDATLSDSEKQMRMRLADEYEHYLQEGVK